MKYASIVNRAVSQGWQAWNVHSKARQLIEQGEDVILLTIGDPDFETPSPIVERAVQSLRSGRTHYTPLLGEMPLRRILAERYTTQLGDTVTADNVIIVPGAQCGLFVSALCVMEPGDEVIVLDPTYTTYAYVIGTTGATTVTVTLKPQRHFQVDPEDIADAVTERTRAIILNSPHNPTGAILHQPEINAIAQIAQRHDLWLITDEVYGSITYEQPHISPASHPDLVERTVTIASLSKSHAMTGWRLGWAIGPSELIQYMGNIMAGMIFGLPPFIQDAAILALTDEWQQADRMRHRYRTRRDLVLNALHGVPGVTCHRPEGGMYIMLDVRSTGLSSFDFADQLLAQEKVALLPGEGFGAGAVGHLRLSLTASEEQLAEACTRVVHFANQIR